MIFHLILMFNPMFSLPILLKSRPLPTPTVRAVNDHDAHAQLVGFLVDESLALKGTTGTVGFVVDTLWLSNIAMENGSFLGGYDDLPIQKGDFA